MPTTLSSLTTSEILERAPYLEEGFKPGKLTMAQLRGILTFSNISLPHDAKKRDLINLFNNQIIGNIEQLRAAHKALHETRPSAKGIVDGLSGEQIDPGEGDHDN